MNNDDVIYQNMFSAKNPPPMCMPIPYTPAQMCIKLFNIFTPGRNIHMCMDMETKIEDKPYLVSVIHSKQCKKVSKLNLISSLRFCISTACEWDKMEFIYSSPNRFVYRLYLSIFCEFLNLLQLFCIY